MTKDTNGSGPELIVLGREAGKPRAARFPAGHDGLVAKAATAMNLAAARPTVRSSLSWPRNYRLAGCTRLAVASCLRSGQPSTASSSSN